MKRFRLAGILILGPALAGLIAAGGCSNKEKGSENNEVGAQGGANNGEAKEKKGQGAGAATEELASTAWGTLKGQVTYDGEPPMVGMVDMSAKDKDFCEKGDTRNQSWKIGPDKGVANVVVWLRAPKGKYFKIPDDLKDVKDPVVLDQPFCAFIPHVFVLYPSYFDGKKQKKSGQVLEIHNSSEVTHNTNYETSDPTLNTGDNINLPPSKSGEAKTRTIEFKPGKDKEAGGEQEINFKCNIHPWMRGYAKVFDHPFAGVTDGDQKDAKGFGHYEMKKVPAGVELDLVCWQDEIGEKVIKKVTLKEGDNVEDFKIKK